MYEIRKIDYDGDDCRQIMIYFNRAFSEGKFKLFPRDCPITEQEILTRWGDRYDRETLVAVDNKVIAAATLRIKDNLAFLNITKDPEYKIKGVGTDLVRKTIDLGISKGYTVVVQTSTHNRPMIRVMEKLGYTNRKLIEDFENYRRKIDAPDYDIYEWKIKI